MSNDTVVEKLLENFNNKIKEAQEIYFTLQTLKKYGANFDLPSFGEVTTSQEKLIQPTNIKIRNDEFFGQTNNEAAEKYLRKIGHAVLLNDIYEALKQGGITFAGDGLRNVYTQLIRANRKFVRIGSGQNASFGLIEWYPKKRNRSEEILKKIDEAKGVDNEETGAADKIAAGIVTSAKEPNVKKVLIRRTKNPAEKVGNSSNEEDNKL
jgi:hypothetical protein